MSVERSIRSDATMKDNTADTRIRMTRRTLLAGAPFVAAAVGLWPERAEANAMFVAPPPGSPLPQLPAGPSPEVMQKLFPGFISEYVKTSGAAIRVLRKGDGPPLLLLHGHLETHVTWHKIATDLSRE